MSIDLPHNFEAEKAVLGSCLLTPALFGELSGRLLTDDFMAPAHRDAWEAMADCDPLDTLTLTEAMTARGTLAKFEGGVSGIAALPNSAVFVDNAHHYARIVKEKAVLRRLIALAAETSVRAGGDCDLAELLTETRAALDRLEIPADTGPVRVGDALEAAIDAIEARGREPSKYAVMTGIRRLDETVGGFRAGQVVVVAANPGGGKSGFSWSTAIRAAVEGVPALCFSLEMKRQEMIERAITFTGAATGIGSGSIDAEGWKKIYAAKTALRGLPLWVDDRKLSMGRIASEARRWRSKYAREGRALLVVDYLGLVRSDARAENRQLEVAAMSRAFKQLAGDLDLPLILVAQLNRQNVTGGIPRKPVLSDLRDSGAIEQDADIVLFPWREGSVAELIVAKHRNGQTGAVPVLWRGDMMAFYDDVGGGFATDTSNPYAD